MGYYTYTEAPIGNFIEKDHGNNFEYSLNNEQDDYSKSIAENYPHKVWVGDVVNGNGYRYGLVKKTVAYVCVDEDDYGQPVIEKWHIKRHREYGFGKSNLDFLTIRG